jgi:hypothetical protein
MRRQSGGTGNEKESLLLDSVCMGVTITGLLHRKVLLVQNRKIAAVKPQNALAGWYCRVIVLQTVPGTVIINA